MPTLPYSSNQGKTWAEFLTKKCVCVCVCVCVREREREIVNDILSVPYYIFVTYKLKTRSTQRLGSPLFAFTLPG